MSVAGCASPFASQPVDPSSPIAEAAHAAAARKARRPRFADIPAAPTDLRSAAGFRAAVAAQLAAGRAVEARVADGMFTLADTEGFAAKARAEGKAPDFGAPTEADRAETEAFAKAARGRAIPPPSQPQ